MQDVSLEGHVGPDCDIKLGYRTQTELNRWMRRCPVRRYEKRLLEEGVVKPKDVARIGRRIDGEVHDAYLFGKASSHPKASELLEDVWK
jgi:pyruvate dehydrogenase E1 component alpha subunit